MGEVGKTQDAVDQRDPEGTNCQLRTLGQPGNNHEIGKSHEGVEEIHQQSIPRFSIDYSVQT